MESFAAVWSKGCSIWLLLVLGRAPKLPVLGLFLGNSPSIVVVWRWLWVNKRDDWDPMRVQRCGRVHFFTLLQLKVLFHGEQPPPR